MPAVARSTWKLGVAYEFQGDRATAGKVYTEAISLSQASGNVYTQVLATTGLGNIQLAENQLYQAAETYQRVLRLVGDLPIPVAPHIHLCLARISYEWNDLGAAQRHGQQSLQLGRPYQDFNDILVACQVFLARLKLARGDAAGATAILAEAKRSAHQHDFIYQMPAIAAQQVRTLLRQDDVTAAANLAQAHDLPISQARVHLAQRDPAAALAVLAPWRQEVEAKDWKDERLKVMLLQAVAHQVHGDKEEAVQLLVDALVMAEPGGFIRVFVDEGRPMDRLLREALGLGITPEYVGRLLAAFSTDEPMRAGTMATQADQSELVEPLSQRELEVLRLIAAGLTNREIADRLYLSLNTVKVHASNIYGKLGVNNRTQAVTRARDLGLLPGS